MGSLSPKSLDEENQLEDADGLTENSRLGCQAKVHGDVVVGILQI
jgi:ferredoxin